MSTLLKSLRMQKKGPKAMINFQFIGMTTPKAALYALTKDPTAQFFEFKKKGK